MRIDPTEKQVDFVRALQRQLHLPDALLDRHCTESFGGAFASLNRSQMSALIDELLTWKAVPAHLQRMRGQQDLPGMEVA